MADITIVAAETARLRRAFVEVQSRIYADYPWFVPPLVSDELAVLDPAKNPAFEHTEARFFLAQRDGEFVGRIAAIISHAGNQNAGVKHMRFGWFECVEDYAVAEALFGAAEAWGFEHGMELVTGPQGFTALDREGMLLEGFDCLPTFATIYNPPYYNEFCQRYGFEKHADTVEYITQNAIRQPFPERLAALAERLRQRGSFRVIELTSRKELLDRAPECFQLLEEIYGELEGFIPMNRAQNEFFLKRFIRLLVPETVKLAINRHDEMVGFMLAVPSLSRALQKARGRLFPFGWYHLWRASKHFQTLDFCLAGVRKKYRGRGVDLLMMHEMFKTCVKLGVEYTESNPEMEHNRRVQAEWKHFEPTLRRRRRIYRKAIAPVR